MVSDTLISGVKKKNVLASNIVFQTLLVYSGAAAPIGDKVL